MKRYLYIVGAVLLAALACYGCFRYGRHIGYADGERDGYNSGYNVGYHAGYEDKNRIVVASVPDHVTAGTMDFWCRDRRTQGNVYAESPCFWCCRGLGCRRWS